MALFRWHKRASRPVSAGLDDVPEATAPVVQPPLTSEHDPKPEVEPPPHMAVEETTEEECIAAPAPAEDAAAVFARHMAEAWSKMDKRELQDAEAAFEAAIVQDPKKSLPRYGLALAQRERGLDDAALQSLAGALAIEPGFVAAHTLMGTLRAKAGDPAGAERALRTAIEHDPSTVPARVHLANLLQTGQRGDESIRMLQEAAALAPADAAIHAHLGHLHAVAGQDDAARKAFEAAIATEAAVPAARAGLANVLARQGQTAEAVEQARIAAFLAPQDSRVQSTFGFLLLLNGQAHAAAQAYARAVALEPDYGDAHSGWATALDRAGDREGAIRVAEAAARLLPDDAPLRAKLDSYLAGRSGAAVAPAGLPLMQSPAPMAGDEFRIYDTYSYLLDHPEHQSFENILRQYEYASHEFSQATYEQSRGVSFDDYHAAYQDWVLFGRRAGLSYVPGKDTTLKIILKAKDEPELIVKWIEHHAAIVGYHNLIIMDCGSIDPHFITTLAHYARKMLVLKYDKYYDTIHSTLINLKFYQFLSHNCRYVTVLDADEFLFGYLDNTVSGPNALRLISRDDEAIYAGTWFPNVRSPLGVGTIIDWTQPIAFSLEKQDLELGTFAGKAVVRSDLATSVKHVGHNLHVIEVIDRLRPSSFGKIGILHLTKLPPEIGRSRALKHLYAKDVVPRGLSPDQIDEQLRAGLDRNTYPGIVAHYAKTYLGLTDGPRTVTQSFTTSVLFDNRTETNQAFSAAIESFDFSEFMALAERRLREAQQGI